jgi:GTP pyrophosphokinase
MLRLDDILERVQSYNPQADLDFIRKAYVFSAKFHQGQLRSSGEPYLIHPLEVAGILTLLRLDTPSIATGLLHDTVEDTLTTLEEIRSYFGEEVAALVDGVTKISKIQFASAEERQAENFRKVLLAMSKDIRVILIKLADRLHNMRTLEHLASDRREVIAKETLEIYAPIAHRLGISWMRVELEDLAFKFLKPESYAKLKEGLQRRVQEREKYVEEVRALILQKLKEYSLEAEVQGRPKHLYGVYRKVQAQNISVEELHDLIAFRIIVETVRQCYEALGIIHMLWKPVPGRFKDYIAMPKPNLYQSLHTTIIGPQGERIEIQIRTRQMHRLAEEGIAAHWKYKEGKLHEDKDDKVFAWLRRLIEWQQDVKDPSEFLETVKVDLFPEDVFIFTPKGEVRELPRGATPVDFAYAVHTDVGHNCVGAKVNGKLVPLRYVLHNGDTVEISTKPGHGPSRDWLKFTATSRARHKIRQEIRRQEQERSRQLGLEILEAEIRKQGLPLKGLSQSEEVQKVAQQLGFRDVDRLLSNVGYGKISAQKVLAKWIPTSISVTAPKAAKFFQRFFKRPLRGSKEGVVVKGIDDILIRYAKCCNPLPGEPIIGFITRGRGLAVHSSQCSRMLEGDPERRVEVQWDQAKQEEPRSVRIEVICDDKPGMLANIAHCIATAEVNISNATSRPMRRDRSVTLFEAQIKDTSQLHAILKSIEKLEGVVSAKRVAH